MILAAILKICKLGHEDVISQLANIGFCIQHTKLPLIKISNLFLHKMPVLVNFSDFFPEYYIRASTSYSWRDSNFRIQNVSEKKKQNVVNNV